MRKDNRTLHLFGSIVTALLIFGAYAAHATVGSIQLFNTGVNNSGGLLANNVADSHYSLISAPAPYTIGMTGNGANDFSWLADGPNSRWIGVTPWLAEWVPVGDYTFRTTFSLSGFEPSTAILNLKLASDNSCKVFLNSVDTGIATGIESFTSFSNFNLNTGFVNGLNTLDFVVHNASTPSVPTHNPMGLRVELSGSATVIPEPSVLGLSMFAAAFLLGVSRKKHLFR